MSDLESVRKMLFDKIKVITDKLDPEERNMAMLEGVVSYTVNSFLCIPPKEWWYPNPECQVTIKVPQEALKMLSQSYSLMKTSLGGDYTLQEAESQVFMSIFIEGLRAHAIRQASKLSKISELDGPDLLEKVLSKLSEMIEDHKEKDNDEKSPGI